ncbi:MAG: nuclease [Bacteroidetes bacterium]|nr:MAG: nuclease [Bacteroidota bacterium]
MRHSNFKFLVFLFYLQLLSCSNTNEQFINREITGKVIKIKDGDTIDILFNGKPLTIRFAHIDCPEYKSKQPFGTNARQFTSDLCFGQTVTIENDQKFDRYKRLIGVVINEKGQNLNKELIKAGLAWHFKKYSNDSSYAELENKARQSKIGLWADSSPTPPWDWRN